jgi:L-threonate 2-dehydrogenase
MSATVSLVGVGNMGAAMAHNLLSRGWQVSVCDLVPQRVSALVACGAQALDSPAQGASLAQTTIVCVVDAPQTDAVLFGPGGVVGSAAPGHTVLLCPTMSPQAVEGFALRLADKGLHAVDAPMSGGPARARNGTMSLMLACDEKVFERLRQLVDALSDKVFRISAKPGDGASTKLVNNLLAAINLVGAAEALALADRLGLDVARTLDVIEQSSGQSWVGSDRMRRAIVNDYSPRAHMALLEKDTCLAVEAAQAVGFDGPLGAVTRDTFARASASGMAAWDDAALYQLFRQ